MLNHTEIEEKLKSVSFVDGASPRWIFPGNVKKIGATSENSTISLLFANTTKELNMGLGREFPKRKLRGNQMMISRSALRGLGIDPFSNPTLEVYVDLLEFINVYFTEAQLYPPNSTLRAKPALKTILNSFQASANSTLIANLLLLVDQVVPGGSLLSVDELAQMCGEMEINPLMLRGKFEVVASVEEGDGKWPGSLGKVILIDDSHLAPFIIRAVSENIRQLLSKSNVFIKILGEILIRHLQDLEDLPVEEYALTTQVMFKDRTEIYLKSTQERGVIVRGYIRQLATECFGLDYRAKYEASLLDSVDQIGMAIILLNVIFMIVTFFLTLLSILLIYSLMMSVH